MIPSQECVRPPPQAQALFTTDAVAVGERGGRRRCGRCCCEMEEQYVRSFTAPPDVIVLDIDSTDDPTHGQQQLSCFHGYYDQHMYHPLVIFDGERGQLVSAVLRPGNAHAARGAMGVLRRIIRRLKPRFPQAQIVVRGDSAFAVPRMLRMGEELDREWAASPTLLGWPRMPSCSGPARRP